MKYVIAAFIFAVLLGTPLTVNAAMTVSEALALVEKTKQDAIKNDPIRKEALLKKYNATDMKIEEYLEELDGEDDLDEFLDSGAGACSQENASVEACLVALKGALATMLKVPDGLKNILKNELNSFKGQ